MAVYEKYTGEITDSFGGWSTLMRVKKDDGTMTGQGFYESFFEIGPDRYVVMPYWHDEDFPVVMSAKEVLNLVRIA